MRPGHIATSNVEVPESIRILGRRVMTEILTRGAIKAAPVPLGFEVDLEKLRIVILKALSIAHRMGKNA